MKNLKFLSLAVAVGLPVTGVAWADNNDQNYKGGRDGGGGRPESNESRGSGGGGAHYSASPGYGGGSHNSAGGFHAQSQSPVVYGGRSYSGRSSQSSATVSPGFQTQSIHSGYRGGGANAAVSGQVYGGRVYGDRGSQSGAVVSSGFQPQSVNPGYRRGGSNTVFSARLYNPGNNFGGHWLPGRSHPDWDAHRQYYWNHHHYCWFNDGWLIIDGGFWPEGYPRPVWYEPAAAYYPNDTVVVDVQRSLAGLGYYDGAVDGAFGPMTSSAIRRYQVDTQLPVTGRIDPSLLNALGVD